MKTQTQGKGEQAPMRRFREEKGSALVMVMFMMLILTLLGVAVLSATVGGARRTLTRENDIQSLQLTQKTLDESVAYIAANLDGKQIKADMLGSTLQSVVNSIPALAAGGESAESENGVKTEVALASTQLISAKPQADFGGSTVKGSTSYTVTLIAKSDVNGVDRVLRQKVRVSVYPDFLNYAFGSEEDLILNGSPQIKGNIYAGKTLRVSNVANYAYNAQSLQKQSLFPKMEERDGGVKPLAFIQSLDEFNLSENNYPARPVNRGADGAALSGELTKANVFKALGIDLSQVRVRKSEQFVRVDVNQSFKDKFAQAFNLGDGAVPADAAAMSAYLSGYPNALRMPTEPIKPIRPANPASTDPETQKKYEQQLDEYEKAYTQYIKFDLPKYEKALRDLATTLTNMQGTVVFDGDLNVDGEWLRGLIQTRRDPSSWLIVNGSLTINNTIDKAPLNLYGSVLVTGSVNLQGNINVDSTLFTLGSTKIQDATITGADGSKEIVLISKGPILLNRVDAFTPAAVAQTLRGFFYTDATAELYGVGSNFDLQGGFFAKGNLTVNAVVGNSTEDASRQMINFDDQAYGKASRFKVNYNDGVFEHQGLALPRVDQVSVKAEKIELIQESEITAP